MISFLHKKISANSFAFIGILGFLDYLLTQLFEQSPRLHVSIVLCSRVSFLKVSSFKMPRWSSMLYFYTIFLDFLLCAISKLHDYSVYAAKIGNAPMIRNWYFSTFCFFLCSENMVSLIPYPAKEFRTPPKPLSCVRQCYSRYRSATDTARSSLCSSLGWWAYRTSNHHPNLKTHNFFGKNHQNLPELLYLFIKSHYQSIFFLVVIIE